jgi:hypothetical protein
MYKIDLIVTNPLNGVVTDGDKTFEPHCSKFFSRPYLSPSLSHLDGITLQPILVSSVYPDILSPLKKINVFLDNVAALSPSFSPLNNKAVN